MKPFGLKPLTAGLAALAATSHMLKAHAAPVKAALPKASALPQSQGANAPRDLSDVDWNAVNYNVDWKTVSYNVDWNTVNYNAPTAVPQPPAPTSTLQAQPPPAPTTYLTKAPPAPTTLVTSVAPAPVPTLAAPAPAPTNALQNDPLPKGLAYNVALDPNAFSITAVNRAASEFPIGFFENTGPYEPTFDTPHSALLKPGNNLTLTVVENWSGRAQKLIGAAGDPATWPEVSFQKGTWYDASYIRGNNGPVVMSSPNGGVAGTSEDLYAGAPDAGKVLDSKGNPVLDATESWTNAVNVALVNYYRAHNNGNGYVRFDDDAAVRTGPSKNVIIEFY